MPILRRDLGQRGVSKDATSEELHNLVRMVLMRLLIK